MEEESETFTSGIFHTHKGQHMQIGQRHLLILVTYSKFSKIHCVVHSEAFPHGQNHENFLSKIPKLVIIFSLLTLLSAVGKSIPGYVSQKNSSKPTFKPLRVLMAEKEP